MTDSLVNIEEVEILNSVQIFYSTSYQLRHGISTAYLFKVHISFCLMLKSIFELKFFCCCCLVGFFVNAPNTIGLCIFFHSSGKVGFIWAIFAILDK